jgi:nucleotide-binding universal stress UspA family protein
MFRKLLVATDGSEQSRKAITAAIDLARQLGARLVAFTAVQEYPFIGVGQVTPGAYSDFQAKAGAEANDHLTAVEAEAAKSAVAVERLMLQTAHPWRAIIEAAQETGCDAIVMASHGRRGVASLVLGSETQRVLTHSTLPVLVVR